jgi:hypothetical protein
MVQPTFDEDVGQPQNTTTSYSPGFMQRADGDLIRWQLDQGDILEDLKKDLKGVVWNDRKKEYEQVAPALMNDMGVNSVIIYAKSFINKNNILSNYNEDEVLQLCTEIEHNMISWLFVRMEEFNLNKNNFQVVRNMIGNAIFASYKRALNQGERDFLKNTERVEQRFMSHEPQRKNWFSNIFKM